MQESAGNEYMNKSLGEGVEIRLRATQYTHEKDAFDHLYDSNSPWDFTVSDAMLNYDPAFIPQTLKAGDPVPALYDANGNAVITIPENAIGYDYLFNANSTLWIESDDKTPSSSVSSTDSVASGTFKAGKHYFLCVMLTADMAGGYELDNPIFVSDNTGAEYSVESFKYPGYIDQIRAYRYIGQATEA